jgi:peptidoglycan-N-acetylglucosamine deacetylase
VRSVDRRRYVRPGLSRVKIRDRGAVVAAGHEIGHHSWAHIPNATQKRAEEEADLVRANESIVRLTGRKARGYRSPAWDL